MTRLRRMKADDVERILRKHGFELISQKGSHRKQRSQAQDTQVIVPFHQGRDLPTGTLRNIMVTAMIPEEEWKSPQKSTRGGNSASSNLSVRCLGISWECDSEALLQAVRLKLGWLCA